MTENRRHSLIPTDDRDNDRGLLHFTCSEIAVIEGVMPVAKYILTGAECSSNSFLDTVIR